MRTVSGAALAKLQSRLGAEPIVVLGIRWVDDGQVHYYADRGIPIANVPGRILSVSGLDNVINVSESGDSQQISVTLDDTDGSLKNIIDTVDVHKRKAYVYQWFNGLAYSDKFLLFAGQISSPFTWNEKDRTLKFEVISQVEDAEVGFDMSEGDFPYVPPDLVGKPWPLCFGTTVNVPALQCRAAAQGTLLSGTGIRDFTLAPRRKLADCLVCSKSFKGYKCQNFFGGGGECNEVWDPDPQCLKTICEIKESLDLAIAEQTAYETDTIRIQGGRQFPQNEVLTIAIDGARFRGTFGLNGDPDEFTIARRWHPGVDDHDVRIEDDDLQQTIESHCAGFNDPLNEVDPDPDTCNPPGLRINIDRSQGDLFDTQRANAYLALASQISFARYNNYRPSEFFWAKPGSKVTLYSQQEVFYIANIIPSTIHRVAAFKNFASGGRALLTVPSSLYTVRQVDYGTYDVMEVVFERPLSAIDGEWEDDIFITQTAVVGPNTVDILGWLIETYTDFAIDPVSFGSTMRDKLENYPMHFPILDRPNIIRLLDDIAYQARCSIFLRNDTFYLRYLAEEPTVDETITNSDVDFDNSVEVFHTDTEDIVTKYVAEWKYDYAINDPNKLILRHNVAKYGVQEETYDFFCFNIQELVRKTATFWLIRKSNTWRKIRFSTFLHKLRLETFDCAGVTLNELGDGQIKCIVEQASYDSDNHTINFECWTPIKSGTRVPYDFAYPANVSVTALFPTDAEVNAGFAGAGNTPGFSVIAPFDHPFSLERFGLIQSFTQSCGAPVGRFYGQGNQEGFKCREDQGDKKPSDQDDQKPEPDVPSGGANEEDKTRPDLTNKTPGQMTIQQAHDQAKQARTEAQLANEKHEGNSTDKGDQDLGEGCKPDGCRVTVTVRKRFITRVQKQPPEIGTTADGQGRISSSRVTQEQCHTFNSYIMARAFADQKQAEAQAKFDGWLYQTKTDDFLPSDVVLSGSDLGTDPDTMQACAEPEADDREMTGQSTTDVENE